VQDVGLFVAYDFPVQIFHRGKWANVTQNPNSGAIPSEILTPTETYKFGEGKAVSFTSTFTNVFNEHAVTVVNEQVDSNSPYLNTSQFSQINGQNVTNGTPWYAAAENAWNVQTALNTGGIGGGPQAINSASGKPLYYQLPRTIRLSARFTF
jgi:hypothetical protein